MNTKVNSILNKQIKFTNNISLSYLDFFVVSFIFLLAVISRVSLFPYVSSDYTLFLKDWYDTLNNIGNFSAIGISIGDYTPPYIYLMYLLTKIPIDSLSAIKLLSCVFDFILAFFCMKIVYIKYKNILAGVLSFSTILFVPTILLNSAFWAQCDAIFTTFIVISIYYLIKNKPLLSVIFFAISFTFKLQAIFFAPMLLLLYLKGRIKFRHFFAVPIIYIISILPAFFAGRNFYELLTIYFSQASQYSKLSLNATNFYLFFGDTNKNTSLLSLSGIVITLIIIITICYIAYNIDFKITDNLIISFSLLFLIIVPFFLPHMHERYFYMADVFSVIYLFYNKRKFYIPTIIIFCSSLSYLPFLFGTQPISLNLAAILMFIAIILLSLDIYNNITKNNT